MWSNGDPTQDLANLNGGSYGLTVTDSSGCVVNLGPLVVTEPFPIVLQLDTIINPTCATTTDGQILITTLGGTAPYNYAWNTIPVATTEDLASLSAGTYQVVLTDDNGCVLTSPIYTVTAPAALTVNLDSLLDVSCNSVGDGAIYSTPSGGTAPYTYVWSNGDSLNNITRLNGGIYTATITDTNGCQFIFGPITIREPAVLTAVTDSINRFVLCRRFFWLH